MNWNLLCIWWRVFFYISAAVGFVVHASHQWRYLLCATSIATYQNSDPLLFVPPLQESPLYVDVLLCWRLYEESSFINIKISFVCYSLIILGSPSLFQSITVLGFTMALSPIIVLYTRWCLFLKWSIQLFEAPKPSIPRRAATHRAFSFR